MSDLAAKGEIKSAQIEVTVIRADGTREEHGVVSYWHRNPFKRLIHKLRSRDGNPGR